MILYYFGKGFSKTINFFTRKAEEVVKIVIFPYITHFEGVWREREREREREGREGKEERER